MTSPPAALTIPADILPSTPLADRPLRVYVAAPTGEAHVARLLGKRLDAEGYHVISRWTERLDRQPAHPSRDVLTAIHRENERELADADIVVAWTAAGEPKTTYGEIATAISLDTRVLWLQGADGRGGNAYDTDPRVTVIRRADHSTAAAWDALLAEVHLEHGRLLHLGVGAPAVLAPPAPPAPFYVTPSLLVCLAVFGVRPDAPATFATLCAAAGEDVPPDVVRIAIRTLCSLGVLEATDPGPQGEARWRRRADIVEDLQREVARLREEGAALRTIVNLRIPKHDDETIAEAAKRWALQEVATLRTATGSDDPGAAE